MYSLDSFRIFRNHKLKLLLKKILLDVVQHHNKSVAKHKSIVGRKTKKKPSDPTQRKKLLLGRRIEKHLLASVSQKQ